MADWVLRGITRRVKPRAVQLSFFTFLDAPRCEFCGNPLHRPKWRRDRIGKIGPLAGLVFCNRECQKAFYREEIPCCWPGCENTRLVEGAVSRRKRHNSFF